MSGDDNPPASRSRMKREAIMRGEPMPMFDGSSKEPHAHILGRDDVCNICGQAFPVGSGPRPAPAVAHPPPWQWVGPRWRVYGMADANGRPVLAVTPQATIEFASPAVRMQTELAPEMEALLRQDRDNDTPASACAVQPGAVHRGLDAEACGKCWHCRVDALLARIDEARKAGTP